LPEETHPEHTQDEYGTADIEQHTAINAKHNDECGIISVTAAAVVVRKKGVRRLFWTGILPIQSFGKDADLASTPFDRR
jgi:hypothetical protein